MADVIQLTDGTTTVELALDTDNLQLLVPGTEMGIPEHDNLYHQSPWAHGEKLARFRLSNRKWPLKILVGDKDSGTAADDLANALNTLGRLIAQARRYHLSGDVSKVFLKLLLDGASQNTYFDAIDLEPSGASILDETSRKRRDAQVSFVLITEPLGYGDEETLCNELGTPHFEEDGDDDGIADQWNESGTSNPVINTNTFLCGSQSQVMDCDISGTHGIYSDAVDCTQHQGEDFVAYAWVTRDLGDDLTLEIEGKYEEYVSLGTAKYSTSTVTATGSDGMIWRRLTVIGTVGASDTEIRMRVERVEGDATGVTLWYVDKCYLHFNISTVPTAWMSCKNIKNHFESITEGAIPYVDVVDIPGSLDAKTTWALSVTTHVKRFYLGRWSAKSNTVPIFWKEFAAYTSGMSARTNDGTTAAVSVTTSWTDLGEYRSTDTDFLQKNLPGQYLLLAAVYNADTATLQFRTRFTEGAETPRYTYSDPIDIAVAAEWRLVVVGPFGSSIDYMSLSLPPSAGTSTQIVLQAKRSSGNANLYCDFFYFLPVSEGCICLELVNEAGWTDNIILTTDAPQGNLGYVLVRETVLNPTIIGSMIGNIPPLYPKRFQRFLTMNTCESATSYNEHDLAQGDLTVNAIKYRPQTEFLL